MVIPCSKTFKMFANSTDAKFLVQQIECSYANLLSETKFLLTRLQREHQMLDPVPQGLDAVWIQIVRLAVQNQLLHLCLYVSKRAQMFPDRSEMRPAGHSSHTVVGFN